MTAHRLRMTSPTYIGTSREFGMMVHLHRE